MAEALLGGRREPDELGRVRIADVCQPRTELPQDARRVVLDPLLER
jgi:hypothetical protein